MIAERTTTPTPGRRSDTKATSWRWPGGGPAALAEPPRSAEQENGGQRQQHRQGNLWNDRGRAGRRGRQIVRLHAEAVGRWRSGVCGDERRFGGAAKHVP